MKTYENQDSSFTFSIAEGMTECDVAREMRSWIELFENRAGGNCDTCEKPQCAFLPEPRGNA